MNCREVENRIYLYRELNAEEQKQTDVHIARCKLCGELAAQLFQQQELLEKIRAVKPQPNNSEWLTRQIMNAVERKEKHVYRTGGVFSFNNSLFVRYAFSLLSVFMIVFYYKEQQHADQLQKVTGIEIMEGTVLNTSALIKTYLNRKEKRTQSVSRYSYYKSKRV